MRLVNIMIDGSAATYTCKSLNDQLDEVAKPKSNESGVKNGNIESIINDLDHYLILYGFIIHWIS